MTTDTDCTCGDCSTGDLPVNPFEALRVSYGMLLGEDDFRALMGNPRGKQMLHSAWLHGSGVVWGFGVRVDGLSLTYRPGLRWTGSGASCAARRPRRSTCGTVAARPEDQRRQARTVHACLRVVSTAARRRRSRRSPTRATSPASTTTSPGWWSARGSSSGHCAAPALPPGAGAARARSGRRGRQAGRGRAGRARPRGRVFAGRPARRAAVRVPQTGRVGRPSPTGRRARCRGPHPVPRARRGHAAVVLACVDIEVNDVDGRTDICSPPLSTPRSAPRSCRPRRSRSWCAVSDRCSSLPDDDGDGDAGGPRVHGAEVRWPRTAARSSCPSPRRCTPGRSAARSW